MALTSVQTAVAQAPAILRPGMEYGDAHLNRKEAGIANGAIPFGAVVVEKVSNEWVLPAASGDLTAYRAGVALIDHSKATEVGYATGDTVTVLTFGFAVPLSEEALALGDTLTVRFSTGGGGSQKGSLRNDTDTSTCVAPLTAMRVKRPGTTNLTVISVGG